MKLGVSDYEVEPVQQLHGDGRAVFPGEGMSDF
jgi:hypothetical protein